MAEDQSSENVSQALDRARYQLARFISDDMGLARKLFVGDMIRFYEHLIEVEIVQPKNDSPEELEEAQSLKKAATHRLKVVQDIIEDKRKRLDGYEEIYSEGFGLMRDIETAWRNQPNMSDLQVTLNTLQDIKGVNEGKL